MDFLIGTLTKKGGQGILRCRLIENQLKTLWIDGTLQEPNWIIAGENGHFFSTCEKDGRGHVAEWTLTEHGIHVLAMVDAHGDAPCHLVLDKAKRFLYCANYVTGSVAVFPVTDGLHEAVQVVQNTGCGFDKFGRQAGPHMHQVSFMPDGRLLAVDLGLDALCIYEVDAETGRLTEVERLSVQPSGSGARHIIFRDENTFYLSHEMGGLVSLFKKQDGHFARCQTLSTLPSGYTGFNNAAAIRLNAQKNTLYVSNRGHESIAEFALDADGAMTFKRHIFCGFFPRDFLVLPDGRLLVADQGSNDPALAVLNGSLSLLAPDGTLLSSVHVPAAVSVLVVSG